MSADYRFSGEYECTLDSKSRLKLPSSLVNQLGKNINTLFTINRGFEKHLMLYPESVWLKKTKEIDQLNLYISEQRKAIRYFYRGATTMRLDKSSRILIPKNLITYAALKKDIVLFAYQEQIEIWDKDFYQITLENEPSEFSKLAEEIFSDSNLNIPSANS